MEAVSFLDISHLFPSEYSSKDLIVLVDPGSEKGQSIGEQHWCKKHSDSVMCGESHHLNMKG